MSEPTLRTSYEFTLPRGYIDHHGRLQKTGVMRLATARDELEPLRDHSVTGPDDPRLTILVLARVVETLGDLQVVTTHEIENLFAVDLAFLQDFYGVINFGTQEEFEALIQAQRESALLGTSDRPAPPPEQPEPAPAASPEPAAPEPGPTDGPPAQPRSLRNAIEELPRRAQ